MRIFYQAYNDWTSYQRIVLETFGYYTDEGYSSIEVELNKKNQQLLELFDEWKVERFVGTVFEKDDYKDATYFYLLGVREVGYPQPESVKGYLTATYDLTDYCENCGVGAEQDRPFRLKARPHWNKGHIFELGWVYDEFFVNKDTFEALFQKRYNLNSREVVLHKTGEIIKDLVQPIIPISDLRLKLEDTPYELCPLCNRKRYIPSVKGFLPGFEKPLVNSDIVKTQEFFGTGSKASRRIYVSRRFWDDLKKLGLKPNLWPVDPKSE